MKPSTTTFKELLLLTSTYFSRVYAYFTSGNRCEIHVSTSISTGSLCMCLLLCACAYRIVRTFLCLCLCLSPAHNVNEVLVKLCITVFTLWTLQARALVPGHRHQLPNGAFINRWLTCQYSPVVQTRRASPECLDKNWMLFTWYSAPTQKTSEL